MASKRRRRDTRRKDRRAKPLLPVRRTRALPTAPPPPADAEPAAPRPTWRIDAKRSHHDYDRRPTRKAVSVDEERFLSPEQQRLLKARRSAEQRETKRRRTLGLLVAGLTLAAAAAVAWLSGWVPAGVAAAVGAG